MAQSEEKNDRFSTWLSNKLNLLKIDENIYLNYIISILEGDESREEKLDNLKSILVDTGSSVRICSNNSIVLLNSRLLINSYSVGGIHMYLL